MPRAWIVALAMFVAACAGFRQTQPSGGGDCQAQICESDNGPCEAVVLEGVWIWNGEVCVEAYGSGCTTVGPDCKSLYPTLEACESAWSRCLAP